MKFIWLLLYLSCSVLGAINDNFSIEEEGLAELLSRANTNQSKIEIPDGLIKRTFAGFEFRFSEAKSKILNDDRKISLNLINEYLYVTDILLTKYPPENYIYVALGASPTFIMAILANIDGARTVDFPLSFRNYSGEIKLNYSVKKYMDEIFNKTSNNYRDYVLIDFIFSGKSIERGLNLLKLYLKDKNSPKQAIAFGLRQEEEFFDSYFLFDHVRMPRILSFHMRLCEGKEYRKFPSIYFHGINGQNLNLTT
ncbi:MAG: hypothetical protein KC505_00345, partial [Myxococcales bacterium]|nr:hypothetical protein [Myxococcales bacterium]